ncbi:hypothetical protein PHYBOEH_005993 [Phytophthora boehmeriae]|uniref:M96 mating-specific protein family n=1 Tax=Phytophthora boehmeriae TaxID=109152 RepID=A0A8T1WPJ8_9STRA|nr:hypothetical protein PHYBOEH_005993 [Phytophthora boehmeriae]
MRDVFDDGAVASQLDESIGTDCGPSLSTREQGILESYLRQMGVLEQDETAIHDAVKSPGSKRLTDSPDDSISLLAKKKTIASWKRRKDELQRLRLEAQAMQTHVTFLTLKRTYEQVLDSNNKSEDLERLKNTAKSERKQCEKAKADNQQLKEKLRNCVQTRNLLQTALAAAEAQRKELLASNAATTRSLQDEMRMNYKLDLEKSFVFNMLEQSADARLNELGGFLYESYTSTADPDTDLVQVHRVGDEDVDAMVEFKRSRLVPFSVDKTSTAAWDLKQLGVVGNDRFGRVVRRSNDLVASEGQFTYMLNGGGNVEIRAHCLMKRVHVPSGVAVLVESTSEWLAHLSSSSSWRHVTRDSGWTLVSPFDPSNASLELCRVQTAIRLRTSDCMETATPRYPIARSLLSRSVSDVVISSFRQVMSSRHQLLDNLLLDS